MIEALADVMVMKGVPEHIRSDNGPEFVARDLRKWLADTGAKTLYIEPGSPWENGYCESFNSKLRDEFLNGEIFYSMKELRVLAERWRVHYNTVRPHSSLGYRPPAPAGMAWHKQPGAWRSGKQRTLPTSPHPRLRRRRSYNQARCATLTIELVQKIGQAIPNRTITRRYRVYHVFLLLFGRKSSVARVLIQLTRIHNTYHRNLYIFVQLFSAYVRECTFQAH